MELVLLGCVLFRQMMNLPLRPLSRLQNAPQLTHKKRKQRTTDAWNHDQPRMNTRPWLLGHFHRLSMVSSRPGLNSQYHRKILASRILRCCGGLPGSAFLRFCGFARSHLTTVLRKNPWNGVAVDQRASSIFAGVKRKVFKKPITLTPERPWKGVMSHAEGQRIHGDH